MIKQRQSKDDYLTEEEVLEFFTSGCDSLPLDHQRVLVIVPDSTRTIPLPMIAGKLQHSLGSRVAQLDFLIALGTHPPMTDEAISRHFGVPVQDGKMGDSRVFNHMWDDPKNLTEIGKISAEEMTQLSGGKLIQGLTVRVNKRIFDYDHILVISPVFPHEVAGFSGGNKYFFPGVSGPEMIHFSHWLGALMTSYEIIGSGYTPVRAMIDRAAAMIALPKSCFAMVLDKKGIMGLFLGTPEEAWEGAAALSAQRHIHTTGRTFSRVLAVMPEMYDDLWVGGKGMYKLEPVVEDGGELIIYAPHIHKISDTHGETIMKIGYHVRDYFLAQWEKYKDIPWGILAHSTHVKGLGQYDPVSGEETPRIRVTLATGISKAICEQINLGYQNPQSLHPSQWEGKEDQGMLVVKDAGEQLYRVQ